VSGGEQVAGRQPCSEEWQVLRAMTHDVVLAAARDGRQHRTFHGFRIEARRVGGDIRAGDLIEVRMSVGGEGCPLDCELIEVARHPISGSACIIQALQVPRFGALRH
jgi:hypothetical protein